MPETMQPLIVTVDDASVDHIQDVAQHLTDIGVVVRRVLPITGVIVATSTSDMLARIEGVEGVHSVESEAVAHTSHPAQS